MRPRTMISSALSASHLSASKRSASAPRGRLTAAVAALFIPVVLAGCAVAAPQPPETAVETQRDATTDAVGPAQSDEVTPENERASDGTGGQDPALSAPAKNPGFDQAELDERLRQAAWADDQETAAQLLDWGADVNAQDATQQSAYLISISEGHDDFLALALAHGADVGALDSWNGTGLIRAAERGHWAVVGQLIQAGVARDHINRVGYQAIHECVWMGRDDATYHATTLVLFAGGVDFSTPSQGEGLTPLQMAEYRGYDGQATLIRALQAEPVPVDPTTSLLTAAAAGQPTAAAAALRAGADPTATDAAGHTALDLATAGTHVQTAQLLAALT